MSKRWVRSVTAVVAVLVLSLFFQSANGLAKKQPGQTKKEHGKFLVRVLLIRHGEKPPEGSKSVDLAPQGKERAKELHHLFENSSKRPNPFPRPDFIFATKNSKKSHRPFETVAPLAKRFKMPINTSFANNDSDKLAQEIMKNPKYRGKTVLISWHHGTAPKVAHDFGAKDAPEKWKSTVFDRVWEITCAHKGTAVFVSRPQHLLPSDSDK